jgi:hypothetical protein
LGWGGVLAAYDFLVSDREPKRVRRGACFVDFVLYTGWEMRLKILGTGLIGEPR